MGPNLRRSQFLTLLESFEGRDDVTWLWYAGVHPQAVLEIRDRLNLDGRLPTSFYLAVLTRKPDLDWMRSTLERESGAGRYGGRRTHAHPRRFCWLATESQCP